MMPFVLRLYAGEDFAAEEVCTALTLEREAYTPYNEMTAVFVSDGAEYGNINRIGLFRGETQIFMGLADNVMQFRKNGRCFTKVRSRSFTSLMTQNEMKKDLYDNVTIAKLVNDYYKIPYVTHEDNPESGYINVKDGTTLWDCIASFGFKLKHHYPYVTDNKIWLSPPESAKLYTISEDKVLEYGTVFDTTKLVSHYHMEYIDGTPAYYNQENPVAAGANIVRHKQIAFDRQFLRNPDEALTFRNLCSRRGCKAKYVVYEGFSNEELGERISFGKFLQEQTICRVRFTFGQNGLRTKVWAYEDGFYH